MSQLPRPRYGREGTTHYFTRIARCKECIHIFQQDGYDGCFGGRCYPHDCLDCGSEKLEIINDLNALPGILTAMPQEETAQPPIPTLDQLLRDLETALPSDNEAFKILLTAALRSKVATLDALAEFTKTSRFIVKFWKMGVNLPNAITRSMIYDHLRKLAEVKLKESGRHT